MRSKLFVLGCFTHDSQGVLAAIHELALVGVELLLDAGFNRRSERGHGAKLHVAILADAELRRFSHDPKFSLFHDPSLRRPPNRSSPVEIKRHHYRKSRRLENLGRAALQF